MSKFKVGDKVRIVGYKASEEADKVGWSVKMDAYIGRTFTIGVPLPNFLWRGFAIYSFEGGGGFWWHESWLELVEDKPLSKFKVGDRVVDMDGDTGEVIEIDKGGNCPICVTLDNASIYGKNNIFNYAESSLKFLKEDSANKPSVENNLGKKHDQGKVQMDLLPVRFLEEVAGVLTFGAKKYDPYNWSKGIKFSRLFAALLRHVYAFWKGESNDPETGLSHLAHATCCLAFMFELMLIDKQWDDRPDIYRGN